MQSHIAEARAREPEETDATILNILDRLGEPDVVVADARERLGIRPSAPYSRGLLEIAAVFLVVLVWPVGGRFRRAGSQECVDHDRDFWRAAVRNGVSGNPFAPEPAAAECRRLVATALRIAGLVVAALRLPVLRLPALPGALRVGGALLRAFAV
jgi:hypothetical protein